MTCPICDHNMALHCRAQVLGKHDVAYFQCGRCRFIRSEPPYWLDEAYDSAITRLDVGLVWRNERVAPIVQAVVNRWFDPKARFIDYGGGYGLMVRMMRDRGFNFYRQDNFCANLFAQSFDVIDVPPFRAELMTTFEVFEHLTDPVAELTWMLSMSNAVLFSTNVQPSADVTPESWWYFTPETGQHVSLYSRSSLVALAERFGLTYCWNDHNIHLFSKKRISNRQFKLLTHPSVYPWYNRLSRKTISLIPGDFEQAKTQLTKDLSNLEQ